MKWLLRVRDYVTRDIWMRDVGASPALPRAAFYTLRTIFLAVRGVAQDRVSVWASSLTYMSLIALLPFVALVMGVGAKLGVPMKIVDRFTGELPDATQEVLTKAAEAFEQSDFQTLGYIAIGLLLYAAIRVLFRIEAAFNHVWGVRRGRSAIKRWLSYGAAVIFAPPLVFGALVATGTVLASDLVNEVTKYSIAQITMELFLPLLPYIAIWVALTLLYWLMPATRVHFLAALGGAVLAGTVIQFAQRGLLIVQVGAYQYGWVFGSFAVIPILLVWIYFTWIIVLYGAELSYGIQHAGSYFLEDEDEAATSAEMEEIALRVALFLADLKTKNGNAVNDSDVAEAIGAPPRRVRRCLALLADGQIARRRGHDRFSLAKDPGEFTLEQVLQPFRGEPDQPPVLRDVPTGAQASVKSLREECLGPLQMSLEELLSSSASTSET